MNLDELIGGDRGIDARYHLEAARTWYTKGYPGQLPSPLVYSAFEYRCAIERVVFELYVIMHDELPGVEDLPEYSKLTSLMSLVYDLAGGNKLKLYRVLTFNSIISESLPFGKTLSIPDIGKLHNLWSKLSEYCHRLLVPEETVLSAEWIAKGYTALEAADLYLKELTEDHFFGAMPEGKMPEEVHDVRRRFIDGEIDESALRMRLKIMEPVLEARMRLSKSG